MKVSISVKRAERLVSILERIADSGQAPRDRALDPIFESGDGDHVVANFIDMYDESPALRTVCQHWLASRYIDLEGWRRTHQRIRGLQLEMFPQAAPATAAPMVALPPVPTDLVITPSHATAPGRSGTLKGIPPSEVFARLPDAAFDGRRTVDRKTTMQWSFNANGKHCAIWDYRGACFSTFGPDHVFKAFFGDCYISV